MLGDDNSNSNSNSRLNISREINPVDNSRIYVTIALAKMNGNDLRNQSEILLVRQT